MALTVHQLALRLAKHIGVTAFDPGDVSNVNPLLHAGMREGDVADLVAAINGALQEVWDLAPRLAREKYGNECPKVSAADVGAVNDPAVPFSFARDWEESVVLPLALQRLSAHPDFKPASSKEEIEREAEVARRIVRRMVSDRPAEKIRTSFR